MDYGRARGQLDVTVVLSVRASPPWSPNHCSISPFNRSFPIVVHPSPMSSSLFHNHRNPFPSPPHFFRSFLLSIRLLFLFPSISHSSDAVCSIFTIETPALPSSCCPRNSYSSHATLSISLSPSPSFSPCPCPL